MSTSIEHSCINTLRFLAVDMVQKANSGHPGMPMGAAPTAFAVWDRFLRFDPKHPKWPDRDRFVLSGGHGCALQYAMLHLTGYDLSLDDLKAFRQWGSRTPGHPEYGLTPGVEATTGPLGQGIANAVGMAIAEASLAARFNRTGHTIVDHYTYVMCGDGDLMEGVAAEAASLAGHLGLGKLIVLYDDNHISIEGGTDLTFSEDVLARFDAYGWHTSRVQSGNDTDEIASAIESARAVADKPSLIAVRTHIGYGAPHKQDTASAHGEPLGADEVTLTKQALDWPLEPTFHVPAEVRERFEAVAARGSQLREDWHERFEAYRREFPAEGAEFRRRMRGELPAGWEDALPVFHEGALATREASGKIMNTIAGQLPELVGGSADLAPSTKTWLDNSLAFTATDRTGHNLHYGVREHAMGSVANGLAYHGGFVPYGSTFLVFADYMRPPLRLAALSHLRVVQVFTHDSIGVGEDGPTHQPVEHLASLRIIPNSLVIRPADANETTAAWRIALKQTSRPVFLALSRQKLPVLSPQSYPAVAGGVEHGAYVLSEAAGGAARAVIVATGSEVQTALAAQALLLAEGVAVRVVSAPCLELFAEQSAAYRSEVLPAGPPIVAVEAGVTLGWRTYLDDADACAGSISPVGLDRFGASAPGDTAMSELGFTPERVAEAVRARLG